MDSILRQPQGWTMVLVGALVIIGVISLGRLIRELLAGDIDTLPQRIRWRRIALASATSAGAFSGALMYVTAGALSEFASYVLWAMMATIFVVNMAKWQISK